MDQHIGFHHDPGDERVPRSSVDSTRGVGFLAPAQPLGTLFRLTLASGVAAAVALHLRRGAPVNAVDAKGRSPLMLSAMRGHIEVCRVLLEAGADHTIRDPEGNDAAMLASAGGHPGVADLISQHARQREHAYIEGPTQHPQSENAIEQPAQRDLDNGGETPPPMVAASCQDRGAQLEVLITQEDTTAEHVGVACSSSGGAALACVGATPASAGEAVGSAPATAPPEPEHAVSAATLTEAGQRPPSEPSALLDVLETERTDLNEWLGEAIGGQQAEPAHPVPLMDCHAAPGDASPAGHAPDVPVVSGAADAPDTPASSELPPSCADFLPSQIGSWEAEPLAESFGSSAGIHHTVTSAADAWPPADALSSSWQPALSPAPSGLNSPDPAPLPAPTPAPEHAPPASPESTSGRLNDSGWEAEPEPDLTPRGEEVARAALSREAALSRHEAASTDTDWGSVAIDLPGAPARWLPAFPAGSGAASAMVTGLLAAVHEGWMLAEEFAAIRESMVEGPAGERCILALRVLLGDLGVAIEDEHPLDADRLAAAEDEPGDETERAAIISHLDDRYAEIEGRTWDAEQVLLRECSAAPVLTKAQEESLFADIASALADILRHCSASLTTAALLDEWAVRLETRQMIARDVSGADWAEGSEVEEDPDPAELDEEDVRNDDIGQAERALAAHLRSAARAVRAGRDAPRLIAEAQLSHRRLVELADAYLRGEGDDRQVRGGPMQFRTAALQGRPSKKPGVSSPIEMTGAASVRRALQRYERARISIVKGNLRRVVWLARRYARSAVPFLDVYQEGQIGLLRAVEKFDAGRGYRFGTYATWWIRQSMSRAVQDQGRTIRIPVHLLERLSKVRRTADAMRTRTGLDPTPEEIGQMLDLEPAKVTRALAADHEMLPLDDEGTDLDGIHAGSETGGAEATPLTAMLQKDLKRLLADALIQLGGRPAHILDLRFGLSDGNARTLEEVGQVYGVTRERIRQIEAKSLGRLPKLLRNRPFEHLCP